MTFEINRRYNVSFQNTLINEWVRARKKNKEKEGRKKEEKQKVGKRRVTFGRLSHRCHSVKCNEIGLLISCSRDVGEEKKRVNFESGSRRTEKFVLVPFMILKSSRWIHGNCPVVSLLFNFRRRCRKSNDIQVSVSILPRYSQEIAACAIMWIYRQMCIVAEKL